jgi:hypothetical protein
MPFQSAAAPSSLAMVVAVPSRPRYLGAARSPAMAFFCSCSLTLAVSRGIVVICERGNSARLGKSGSEIHGE